MAALVLLVAALLLTVPTSDGAPGKNWRPVVLMHGLASNQTAMNDVKAWIEADFPGIYVCTMEIGNGVHDSWFMPMNEQVATFAANVQTDRNLTKGFNLIGHSQGGMISRAYIERYTHNPAYPPVYNFISWAGPQAGGYGP